MRRPAPEKSRGGWTLGWTPTQIGPSHLPSKEPPVNRTSSQGRKAFVRFLGLASREAERMAGTHPKVAQCLHPANSFFGTNNEKYRVITLISVCDQFCVL